MITCSEPSSPAVLSGLSQISYSTVSSYHAQLCLPASTSCGDKVEPCGGREGGRKERRREREGDKEGGKREGARRGKE